MKTLIRTSLLSLLLIAAIGLVAGCSSDDARDGGTTASSSKDDTGTQVDDDQDAEQATAKLDVRLEQVGSKSGGGIPMPVGMACTKSIPANCTSTVECPVAEDTKDDGTREVCVWLAGEGKAVLTEEPVEREVCTQEYGGPEVATVKGTLDGEDVDASFSRQNGCEISRFDAVMKLWSAELVPPAPDEIEDPPSAFESERQASSGTSDVSA